MIKFRHSAINPCYQCENRHAVCHADCELYKTWREKQDAERDERIQKSKEIAIVNEYITSIKIKTIHNKFVKNKK